MAKKKRKFNRTIPPCPDPLHPERYKLIKGQYGYHWQLKRGTNKPAVLNEVLTRSAALTKPSNNASKQLMTMLSVYTQRMELKRVAVEIAGAFKKSALKTGDMDFSYLHDLDFQEKNPFHELYTGNIKTKIENDTLYVQVPVGNLHVKKLSNITSGYELEAILIFGDPAKERGLRIEPERSRLYTFKEKGEVQCPFSFVLPPKNRPWMLLIYIEGIFNVKGVLSGYQYRRMKVIKTSSLP